MASFCQARLYADACVQTSPKSPATHILSEGGKVADLRLKRVMYAGENVVDTNCTPPERIRRVYPKSPAKPYLALNGSPLAAEMYSQRRIVSVPEATTTSSELMRSILLNPRCVSMPSSMQNFASTLGSGDDTSLSGSFSFEETDQSHLRLPSYWSPPSLPPTPDSVEIVDNSFRLPEFFLRNENEMHGMKKYQDEGWLTWANSPPRPIPALHGPASLPYARCPSGAEGTVIEEHSTVPGLIWGLNGDARLRAEHEMSCANNDQDYASLVQKLAEMKRATKTIDKSRCQDANKIRPAENEPSDGSYGVPSVPTLSIGVGDYSTQKAATGKTAVSDNQDFEATRGHVWNLGNMNQELLRRHSLDQNYVAISEDTHSMHLGKKIVDPGLDVSAPVFVPTYRKVDCVTTNGLQIRPDLIGTVKHDKGNHALVDVANVSGRGHTIKHPLPTPPDSTSPLWSSNSPVSLPENYYPTLNAKSLKFPVANLGLNLLTPAARIDELTEQIHQLNIQQQINLEALARLNANVESVPALPIYKAADNVLHTATSHLANAMPIPPAPRPEMPISLPDLVAQHTPGHTPEMIGSALLPPVMLANPPTIIENPKPRKANPVTASSILQKHLHSERDDKDPGTRRPPRSVPFGRLLEKLASVPEETSLTDEDSSLTRTHISTSENNGNASASNNAHGNVSADSSDSKESLDSPSLAAARSKWHHKQNPIRETTNAPTKVDNNDLGREKFANNSGSKHWKKSVPGRKGSFKPHANTNAEPAKNLKKNSAGTKPRRK